MSEIEIWKDIPGYETLYQVSNFGNVKSLNYRGLEKEGILKSRKNGCGYMFVGLSKDGKEKNFRVHRLVAFAFIPNPKNLPCVNHKDENKENNTVDNLEWCTHEYNMNYGTRNERASKSMRGKLLGKNNPMYGKHLSEETKKKLSETKRKPILQYTKEGIYIREWESVKSVTIELNINLAGISQCCKGKRKSAGGFIWKYKE